MHNQVGYHPFKFELDPYRNKRESAFWINLGPYDSILELSLSLAFDCKNKFTNTA